MVIKIEEREMISILNKYVEDKFSVTKRDSFIIFEDDENLEGLHFSFKTDSDIGSD